MKGESPTNSYATSSLRLLFSLLLLILEVHTKEAQI
jgi:hypothetical protein